MVCLYLKFPKYFMLLYFLGNIYLYWCYSFTRLLYFVYTIPGILLFLLCHICFNFEWGFCIELWCNFNLVSSLRFVTLCFDRIVADTFVLCRNNKEPCFYLLVTFVYSSTRCFVNFLVKFLQIFSFFKISDKFLTFPSFIILYRPRLFVMFLHMRPWGVFCKYYSSWPNVVYDKWWVLFHFSLDKISRYNLWCVDSYALSWIPKSIVSSIWLLLTSIGRISK